MKTKLNITINTFKTNGIDNGEVTPVGTAYFVADEDHVKHSMRDFSAATGGSGDGTIEDMKDLGNGATPNGIPVIGGPVVEVDGKPIKVCKYFGQDKCRFDHWRTFDRKVWELIRNYGSYYVRADKE